MTRTVLALFIGAALCVGCAPRQDPGVPIPKKSDRAPVPEAALSRLPTATGATVAT